MSPRKPVKKLYDFCLDEVLKYIFGDIFQDRGNVSKFRNFFIGFLHAGIRDHLIERAVLHNSSKVFDIPDILELLADSATRKLYLKKRSGLLVGLLSGQLYSKIDRCNIIGLHELLAKVNVEHCNTSRIHACSLLHNALRRGLASNLRVLTLHNAADNESLKLLGQYAEHLTYLDITLSWHVDDVGIGNLLLKDSSWVMMEAHLGGFEPLDSITNDALSSIPEPQTNRTCETLQEVRIQDTNTSSVSVLLLLMFAKNLKSLGGFLYYRNIGDAVLSVKETKGAPPHLKLTDLFDTQLPLDKIKALASYLPNLTSLYTRATWLPQEPGILPPLTQLTADFDFVPCGTLIYNYLLHSGETIRKLVLIDQVAGLCIASIGKLCPNLQELTGRVHNFSDSENIQLKRLVNAKVRLACPSTFIWIMEHAPILDQFEVLVEWEEGYGFFGNSVIQNLTHINPPSMRNLRHLCIHISSNFPREPIFLPVFLTIDAAYMLCFACDNLKILGELHTWNRVSSSDVAEMSQHIKENNLDLQISYHGVLFPAI